MEVLTKLLAEYLFYLESGFAWLYEDSWYLFGAVTTIDIMLTGIAWMYLKVDVVPEAIKRFGMYVFYGLLLTYWPTWSAVLAETFVIAGQKSIGGSSGFSLRDPSAIIDLAIDVSSQSFDLIEIDFFSPGTIPLALFSLFIIIITFLSLALAAVLHFITVLEFFIVILAGYFLIPWGVWTKTAFISQNILGYLFASCIKLFVLALVITLNIKVGQNIIDEWTKELITIDGDIKSVITKQIELEIGMLLFAIITLMTVWKIPSYAAGLVSGGPTSTLGSFVASAATLGLAMTALTKAVGGLQKAIDAGSGAEASAGKEAVADAANISGNNSVGSSGNNTAPASQTTSQQSSSTTTSTSSVTTSSSSGSNSQTVQQASSPTATFAKKALSKMQKMDGPQPRPKNKRTDDED